MLSETKTPGAVRHFQWNAPEIIGPPKGSKSGPLTESKPADVFAFAMLAVEVYTGELPFGDIPNEQAVLKIFNRERPSKPAAEELTEDMWKFVKRCWGQRPKKRPTIDEVVRIWEGFVNRYVVPSLGQLTSQYSRSISPPVLRYPQPAMENTVSHPSQMGREYGIFLSFSLPVLDHIYAIRPLLERYWLQFGSLSLSLGLV